MIDLNAITSNIERYEFCDRQGELKDIKRRLQEDGIDPEASDEQKLRHLWQLYLKTEVSVDIF